VKLGKINIDHGNKAWGGINYNEIPYLSPSIVIQDACLTCSTAGEAGNSFCMNAIRKGALGFVGAVSVSILGNQEPYKFLKNLYSTENTLGQSFSNVNMNPYPDLKEYMFVGDPTFKINRQNKVGDLPWGGKF
jgi:hypothetical protein